jgi:hypothetical protein
LNDKNIQTALLHMQKSVDYLIEENRVLREQLKSKTGSRRIVLTKTWRSAACFSAIDEFKKPHYWQYEFWNVAKEGVSRLKSRHYWHKTNFG